MPRKPRQANHTPSKSWPTVLTLRIQSQKRSFAPTFRTRPGTPKKSETGCSCAQLPQLSIAEDDADTLEISQNTLRRTIIATFIFFSPRKIIKAKELCSLAHESCGCVRFRSVVHELMQGLAKLCEGKPNSTDQAHRASRADLKPFRTKEIGIGAVSRDLQKIISAKLAPSEIQEHGMGYVYILRSCNNASTLAELKIGFTKFHPENRAQELARCLTRPEVVGHTPLLPHAKRIESIIHTELVACRKVHSCGQCGRDHREWFTISHADAREVVTRWSRWVLQRPYREGRLTDEWRNHLNGKDFTSIDRSLTLASLWADIIDQFQTDISNAQKREQFGAYLNACYLSTMVGRVLGTQEKCFETLVSALQEIKTKKRGGMAYQMQDYLDMTDSLMQSIQTDVETHTSDHDRLQAPEPPKQSTSWKERLLETAETIRNTKTGALSVSDLELGISESPLGDATMLPVITMKELKHFDAPVKSWVGYNPTHIGFQYLQEAYRSGKWMGSKPEFKLPKVFRKSGISKLSDLPRGTEQDVNSHASNQSETQYRKTESIAKEDLTNLAFSTNRKDETGEASKTAAGQGERGFRFTGGPENDTFEWTTDIDNELLRNGIAINTELIRNGRRDEVERRLKKSWRYYGVPCGESSGDESLSSLVSDSEISDDELTSEIAAEDPDFDAEVTGRPPKAFTKPKIDVAQGLAGITQDKAKRWLHSL